MKNKKNQFLVDLSPVKLSDEQLKSIDSVIQKAVSAELAKIHTIGKIKIVPNSEADDEVGMDFNKIKKHLLGLWIKVAAH